MTAQMKFPMTLASAALLSLSASGCQFARDAGRSNDYVVQPQRSTESASAQLSEMPDSLTPDMNSVIAVSNRIDDAVSLAIQDRVPANEFNLTSGYAASYPARPKIKSSGGSACAAGCSH